MFICFDVILLDIFSLKLNFQLYQFLFLKLNKWIEKIYENKRESEEFYRKLNLELCALIKAL